MMFKVDEKKNQYRHIILLLDSSENQIRGKNPNWSVSNGSFWGEEI